MERRAGWRSALLYIFIAAGASLYLTTIIQSASATVLSYGVKLRGTGLLVFAAVAAFAFAGLAFGIRALAKFEAGLFGTDERIRLREDRAMLAPALFLLLTPFLYVHYFTRDDLRARLAVLGVAVVAAVIDVRLTTIVPLLRTCGGKIRALREKLGVLPLRRKLVILFFAAFLGSP